MPTLAPPAAIAAFDFDGTLTWRDTFIPFLVRGLGWPRFLWAVLRCSPWLAGYALRLLPNDVAKARLMQLTLGGRELAEVQTWTTRWLAQDFKAALRPWAMARLAHHQQAGHYCVLVSASPDIYLQRVADELGFDALLCTEMAAEQSRLTGAMHGPNCYGEQKVLRLKTWLSERFGLASFEGIPLYAYGDTRGDKPMLRLAQHAWYRSQPWKSDAGQN